MEKIEPQTVEPEMCSWLMVPLLACLWLVIYFAELYAPRLHRPDLSAESVPRALLRHSDAVFARAPSDVLTPLSLAEETRSEPVEWPDPRGRLRLLLQALHDLSPIARCRAASTKAPTSAQTPASHRFDARDAGGAKQHARSSESIDPISRDKEAAAAGPLDDSGEEEEDRCRICFDGPCDALFLE